MTTTGGARTGTARTGLAWAGFVAALTVPLVAAAWSPLLAYRAPIYILAGFAGIAALCLVFAQPVLAAGYLPGLSPVSSRRAHRWAGAALALALVIHVGGLWITSPPDVIDALLFTSPTPFSAFGVIAMWSVFAAGLMAAFRRHLGLRPRTWRRGHTGLVLIAVVGGVVHAVLIVGTMETFTKYALCALALAALAKALTGLRSWVR